jgi:deoxyguanosine kinase
MANNYNCYISIGSNQGDRLKYLQKALALIEQNKLEVIKVSSIYQSESWGFKSDPFLNACIKISTNKTPQNLLKIILKIENILGRKRNEVSEYQSRTIDLDILFYGNLIVKEKKLIIPHPRIQLRNFVLSPLNEISKDLIHPILKKSIKQLVKLSTDKIVLEKLKYSEWTPDVFLKYKHIVIEGNIGVGKTTLTQVLSKRFKVKAQYEEFINNPYLKFFYENSNKNSLDVETYFLKNRIKSGEEFWKNNINSKVISDYSIYKSMVFSKQNLKLKNLKNYMVEFKKGLAVLPKPDLLIYLDAPSNYLLKRINKRGRGFEKMMTEDYLKKIEKGYKYFLKKEHPFEKIILPVLNMDFLNNENDLQFFLRKIDSFKF